MKSIPLDVAIHTFEGLYPDARCTLDWTTPLELLIATILAAQCTDARVNIVTKSLFKTYRSPQDYIAVTQEELEKDIHSCGTYHMKALAIQETCRTLLRDFGGEVPRTMKEMLTLRGVGRKTASIVLSTAFGVLEGIPIDTHCMRLTHRMGFTQFRDQARIERELMRCLPRKYWTLFSHYLVAHGRAVCTARSPRCSACAFAKICPRNGLEKAVGL
jgi:endonuclease III